jgi:hypothetical protein
MVLRGHCTNEGLLLSVAIGLTPLPLDLKISGREFGAYIQELCHQKPNGGRESQTGVGWEGFKN